VAAHRERIVTACQQWLRHGGYLWAERFTQGLTPYSTVGGTGLARYQIVTGPHGQTLRYIGGTSFVDNAIERAVPDARFKRLRVKFMVEAASFDNAATMLLLDNGVAVAYLRPREDTFVDGANRVAIALGTNIYEHVGASALAIGVWYELELRTTGAYTITRLDNSTVFASGAIAAAPQPAYTVDALRFVEDSDAGSPATQFTDILIYSR
jgi:hypothetical protein